MFDTERQEHPDYDPEPAAPQTNREQLAAWLEARNWKRVDDRYDTTRYHEAYPETFVIMSGYAGSPPFQVNTETAGYSGPLPATETALDAVLAAVGAAPVEATETCATCRHWKVFHGDEGTEEWGDCTDTTVSMEYAENGFHTSRSFGCRNWEEAEPPRTKRPSAAQPAETCRWTVNAIKGWVDTSCGAKYRQLDGRERCPVCLKPIKLIEPTLPEPPTREALDDPGRHRAAAVSEVILGEHGESCEIRVVDDEPEPLPTAFDAGRHEPAKVYAPWTDAQRAALRERQKDVTRHPYTCHEHSYVLQPRAYGWWCPKCYQIVQTWALASDMAPDPLSPEDHARIDAAMVGLEDGVAVGRDNEAPAPPEDAEERALREAVELFSAQMLQRLLVQKAKGYHGWDDPTLRSIVRDKLRKHVDRACEGDRRETVDLANLAMMLWRMGYEPAPPPDDARLAEIREYVERTRVGLIGLPSEREIKLWTDRRYLLSRLDAVTLEREQARKTWERIDRLTLESKHEVERQLEAARAEVAAQAARIAALEGALRRLEKAELAYRSAPHMLDGIEAEMGRTWAEMLAAGDAARDVLEQSAAPGEPKGGAHAG